MYRTLLALFCAVGLVAAQQPTALATRLKGAALFKNGLAMVTREATVPAAGTYVIEPLPLPVHGSFWVTTPPGVDLLSAAAVVQDGPRATPAANLAQMLRANVGRQVEVRTADGWMSATILKLPAAEPAPPPIDPYRLSARGYADPWSAPSYPSAALATTEGGLVLLATTEGQMALHPSEIRGLRGKELLTSFDAPNRRNVLRVNLGGGGVVQVSYLLSGMTWAPSYRVRLRDDQQADVELKAVVINDVEDLVGADLNFITGFPNIRFAGALDPMARMGDMNSFLNQLANPGGQARGGAMTQQVMSNAAAPDSWAAGPTVAAPPLGEAVDDLFYYPQPGVTLARGDRGYYPVFARTVPAKSLYTYNADDSVEPSRPGDDRRTEPPPVWHVLRLTNDSQVPWTTAPALAVKGDRVLGQDQISYNAPGASTDLRLTRAADILARAQLRETQRNANVQRYGYPCDATTVEGTIELNNRRAEAVTVEVSRRVTGEITAATEPNAKTLVGGQHNYLNPIQTLRWTVEIKPGETARLTYTYVTYRQR